MLLSTAVIDEHIPAFLRGKQMVAVRKLTSVAILKQHEKSANAAFTKHNKQHANIKPHLEAKDRQGSTIEE